MTTMAAQITERWRALGVNDTDTQMYQAKHNKHTENTQDT